MRTTFGIPCGEPVTTMHTTLPGFLVPPRSFTPLLIYLRPLLSAIRMHEKSSLCCHPTCTAHVRGPRNASAHRNCDPRMPMSGAPLRTPPHKPVARHFHNDYMCGPERPCLDSCAWPEAIDTDTAAKYCVRVFVQQATQDASVAWALPAASKASRLASA